MLRYYKVDYKKSKKQTFPAFFKNVEDQSFAANSLPALNFATFFALILIVAPV